MNVSCTSCSAKYAIPDEKVRGKKVKITCKHCGTGIIVDGTKLDAPTAAAAPAPVAAAPAPLAAAPAPLAAAPAPVAAAPVAATPGPAAPAPAATSKAVDGASELSFDVAYPDDRQESLTVSAIADKYLAGTLTDEAFIWREGMPDWKAPLQIPEVAAAVAARGPKKAPASPFSAEDDEATKIQESPYEALKEELRGEWREPGKEVASSPAAAFALRPNTGGAAEKPSVTSPQPVEVASAAVAPAPVAAPAPAVVPAPAAVPAPAPAAAPAPLVAPVAAAPAPVAAKTTAARRSAARGGGDLFGDLAAAGSEDDESLGTDAKDPAPKLTGQRNESSVLFSLDALTKPEQKPAAGKASPKQDDAALLMGLDSSPSSLANVGNAFGGSAFAAPDFNAPVVAPVVEARAAEPLSAPYPEKKKGGAGVWIALLVVALLAGGGAAMVFSGKLGGASTSSAPSAPTPAETTSPPTPTAEPQATAVAASEPSGSAAAAQAGTAAVATAAPAGVTATPAPQAAGSPAAATPVATPAKPSEPTKPADKPDAPADKPADKPAEASSAPPFDTAAAKEALGAAAANAGSCKTPDGPTGSGKVSVTFMPSGRATNTQVSGDLAGTAVGGCVAKLFRSAKVPAFSGDAVTVTKSFTVQ